MRKVIVLFLIMAIQIFGIAVTKLSANNDEGVVILYPSLLMDIIEKHSIKNIYINGHPVQIITYMNMGKLKRK